MQRRMTRDHVQNLLNRITIGNTLYDSWAFRLLDKGDGFLFQLEYHEPDVRVANGPPKLQRARKWYISPYATDSEVVRTVYKAVLCSLEHRLGEHFRFGGDRVYNPHFDVVDLGHMDFGGHEDLREGEEL